MTQIITDGLSVTSTTNSTSLLVTGSGYGVTGIDVAQTATGTYPAAGPNNIPLNRIIISSDDMRPGNTSTAGFVTGKQIYHTFGGAACYGGRMALETSCNLTSTPNAASTNNNFVGAAFKGYASAACHGTGTTLATAKGAIFGSNPIASLVSGATNYLGVAGEEINVNVDAGASVSMKVGLSIANNASDAIKGTGVDSVDGVTKLDSAIAVSNQGNTVKWTYGMLFHSSNGYFPFDVNSSVIKTTAGTIGKGIDFSATTIANNAFESPGFAVGSTGFLELGTYPNQTSGITVTPAACYIDFHSGTTTQDYDFRFLASGGGASAGLGVLYATGVFCPHQATTAAAPAYVKGGMYFDTSLNKMRIGGATGWETVASA